MSRMTFVVEFEDGKEPPVHAHMEAFGGKVVAVAFRDALADDDFRQVNTTTHKPMCQIRCFICGEKHPIGVACPLSTFTSVVG